MKTRECALCRWLRAELGVPSEAALRDRCNAWDWDQTNDFDIWDHDPFKDQLAEAFSTRDTNPKAGFQQLLALAQQGSVWGMVHVAASYREGNGTEIDPEQAEEWCYRAAELGSLSALLRHASHRVAVGDLDGFEATHKLGAAREWAPSYYWLAWAKTKRSNSRQALLESKPLLERAAAAGSLSAQWKLCLNMCKGRYGWGQIATGFALKRDFIDRITAEMNEDKVAKQQVNDDPIRV